MWLSKFDDWIWAFGPVLRLIPQLPLTTYNHSFELSASCTHCWPIQQPHLCHFWLHAINKMKHLQRVALSSRHCWKKRCKCTKLGFYPRNNWHFPLSHSRNLVRNSRQSQLKSVDNSSSDQVFLGKAGKDLEFGHLTQTVDVAEYSAQESDLDSIHTWIKRL